MSKNVILFLTSPNSVNRSKMCLKNFKQLLNLGYDIITLSTTDFLPSYIVEKSKHLIYDYTSHKCDKKFYYNYYKASGGGYFMYDINSHHKDYNKVPSLDVFKVQVSKLDNQSLQKSY